MVLKKKQAFQGKIRHFIIHGVKIQLNKVVILLEYILHWEWSGFKIEAQLTLYIYNV